MILMMCILFGTSCGGQEAAEPTLVPPTPTEPEIYYSLIVDADPSEGGIALPAAEEVLAGDVVQVEAKPAVGYEFTGWSGAVSLSSPSLSLTMDGDKYLTAHFNKLATNTPLPPTITPTPKHTPTPEVEPTSEDPYLLTDWCLEHVGCEKFEVRNQSPYAIGIFLRHEDSGAAKDFYVPPKGNVQITLRPGRYYYIFTTCGGKYVYEGYHHLSAKWIWLQKEKFCKLFKIFLEA
jgi:hypothetical protein